MRALVCRGDGKVALRDVEDPMPEPGEALIRIEASAVCGSERRALLDGFDGNMGHEACGTVIDPGSSRFSPGDRVGLSAVAGCGQCERCIIGQELHCRHGSRVMHGWHAELAAVPASILRSVPDGIDAGVGALLTGDPLGVPARGLRKAPPTAGDRVLIVGLGPVGLGHLVVRSFHGAQVFGIEPSSYRRNLAIKLGASAIFAPGCDIGIRPRLVIECSGHPDAIAGALEMVDTGGVVLQSAGCSTEIPINISDTFITREVTVTGSWYYATEDYPGMVEMFQRGLPINQLLTHDVLAANCQSAIGDFLQGQSGKVVLRWS